METKKRKLNESPHFECCVCGESGTTGFTNIYNISLREKDDFLISFVEVVNFVLDIEVLQESSDICVSCKPKIIEYYHFKKRSQSIKKKLLSPLIQEIIKIVNNYITKNDIKSITIEESRDKLVLMEKTPLVASYNSNTLDIEIKREPVDADDEPKNENELIKEEIEEDMTIKQETHDFNEISFSQETHSNDHQEPIDEQQSAIEPLASELKLDRILQLNQEIFNMINSLDHKFNEIKSQTTKCNVP